MNPVAEDILMHYGVKRRSGRYPWGSGDSPYQHSGDFISRVDELKGSGRTEKEIAEELGLSTTDLRMQLRVAKHERRALEADRARSLRDDGFSLNEIAEKMGYANDSSVRSLLNENTKANKDRAKATAEILKKELDEKRMLDVGAGVEKELGVSPNTLKEALFILETEGYNVYGIGIPQVTNTGKQTNTPVLCLPDVEYKEPYQNFEAIQSVRDYYSRDSGKTFTQLQYPASLDGKRVGIRYGDEGGIDKDGVIEIRRGTQDLSLGDSHYAQVRILVDGTHYLKGMAMYSDDLPEGVDIMFNTNKKSGTPKEKVMKPIKDDDPDNPFGAAIKANGQSLYLGKDGKEHLSPINKIKEEGDWDKMSRNLSSQFLSKQPIQLIKSQLNLTYSDYESVYDDISSLTNPTVKKKMLLDFANECDSAVVHLKSAALPRQSTQVILPLTKLKETEIYAPNYRDGEQVALVRYPHGGTFEIPVLTVNNKNQSGRSILGDIRDAVGINPKVAERLSGADFDGDQVVVIPTNDRVRIKSTPALKGLKNFDPKTDYAIPEGNPNHVKYMTKDGTQKQMGMISNLITDMTLKGAPESEIVRAVKHSMVVIDAEKHKLDYKQSEKDNGIAELKKAYQGYTDANGNEVGGASTLLSRRKQDVQVFERQGSGRIDKDTGKVIYKQSGRTYEEKKKVVDKETGEVTYVKTGKILPAMSKSKLLTETDDVRTLSSGTRPEAAYADYANKMKALSNKARKEYTSTGKIEYSPTAKATYKDEVAHIESMLFEAETNAPRERRAQAIANSVVKAKIQDNPDMAKNKKEIRKANQIAITNARAQVGASGKETRITINDREWEAIQAGAISENTLLKVLRYSDPTSIKERATPRTSTSLSNAKVSKLKAMKSSGYTNAQIADALGISSSTVSKYLQ